MEPESMINYRHSFLYRFIIRFIIMILLPILMSWWLYVEVSNFYYSEKFIQKDNLGDLASKPAHIFKNFLLQLPERYQFFFYNNAHQTVSFICLFCN